MDRSSIERVRAICRELPECEVEGDRHHRISVRNKTVGWHTVDHHGDGRVALTVRAKKGENAALVASDPERFFMPPYVAHHGYVGIYLDLDDVEWSEVRELIFDGYRLVAPRKLARLIE